MGTSSSVFPSSYLNRCRTLLAKSESPTVPVNLLSFLEKLTTFPTDPKELNSWWVEELGTKPPPPKGKKGKGANNQHDDSEDEDDAQEDKPADDDDDWRKFFDEPAADAKDKDKAKQKSARVHTLTLHQSLHSLASHRAVFTRCWLALLPRLSSATIREGDGKGEVASRGYALRVLNILHRGVLPHLTRPVLVMDWVGGCVDYGTSSTHLSGCTSLTAPFRWYCGPARSERTVHAHQGL